MHTIMDLKAGDHVCQLYRTEEEHKGIITHFLRRGLENGEKVLYIVDSHTVETILGYLREDGLDVEPYSKRGQLVFLTVSEAYMKEGVFDPDSMSALLESETKRAVSEGYAALRVTGEMTWALRGLSGFKNIIEYEAKLNNFFSNSKCLALCQYDMQRFNPVFLLNVLRTHPIAVVGMEIFENFYYVPPDELLSNDFSAAELNRWLLNLSMQEKIEDALKKSEERYRDLYENAPDGIYSIGHDGTIIEVNNTWLIMLGYEKDEVAGKMKLTDLLSDYGIRIFQNTFAELKEKGFIGNIDFDLKRKDGTLLPVLMNATAIYDKNGNFLKSRSIVRDNSARKTYERLLRHAAEAWKKTFDSMPYGVMVFDADFNLVRMNEYISRLFDISYKEAIGKKCWKLLYGKDEPTEECQMQKSRASRSMETFEYYFPKANKQFMGSSTPVLEAEGLITAYVVSLVDITEIKDKEKKLNESRTAFFNMLKDLDFSYKELKALYKGLIFSLVHAIEAKSHWTKGHSERVTNYALAIAREAGLKEKELEILNTAALLHDIGKIGTYDIILDKPGKLTAEEFALVKMHPVKGEEILKPISQLKKILPIIRHHHERVDGKGYPDGIKGEEIPFSARILHVADSFDAMTADRPYRPAPGVEYAVSELKKYSGTQFDSRAVEAFLKVLERPQG